MRSLFCLVLLTLPLHALAASDADIADQAERAIPQFHMSINGDQFDAIWQRADEKLKQRRPQAQFVAQLGEQKSRLGDVQSTQRTSWKLRKQGSDSLVTLRYRTQYAKGVAAEEFLVHLHGNSASIAHYHVKAPALH